MPSRVVTRYSATRPGSRSPNQDRIHVGANYAFVLDGASSFTEQRLDGSWYAEQLARGLSSFVDQHPTGDLRVALSSAISVVTPLIGDDGMAPSGTAAITRWADGTLDVLALGDSTVVAFLNTGDVRVFCDDRLESIGETLRVGYHAALRQGEGFGDNHRSRLMRLQDEQRRWRNRPGGYWIASTDPAAGNEAMTDSFNLHEVEAVLLLTDGVADAVSTYTLFTWEGMRRYIHAKGADGLIATIHRAEQDDAQGQRWPRGKRHDDKSVVLIEFDTV